MAKDLIHSIVREAIEKDGWNITHDPYPVKLGGFDMDIDLGAENILAAERAGEKIAIEIKEVFKLPFAQMVIAELKMRLVIINLNSKTVAQWIG